MFCKNCGGKNSDTAKFCKFCGCKLDDINEEKQTKKNGKKRNEKEFIKEKEEIRESSKKKLPIFNKESNVSWSKIIGISAAVVVAVVVVVLCIILINTVFDSKTKSSANSSSSAQTEKNYGKEKEEGKIKLIKVRTENSDSSEYTHYSIYVENGNNFPIEDISFTVSYLDSSNNIVDSGYATYYKRVLSGQTVATAGDFEKGKVVSLQIDSCRYEDTSGKSYEVKFDTDLETADLTKQGEKIYSDESDFSDSPIKSAVKLSDVEDKLIVGNFKAGKRDEKYHKISCTVKNNTGDSISSLEVRFVFLNEKGNIVENTSAYGHSTIKNGQSITIEDSIIELPKDAKYFTVDGYEYKDANNKDVRKYLSIIPKACEIK